MIDWLGVLTNGLWIAGLASLLATASYYEYVAAQSAQPRRAVFGSRRAVFCFALAAAVFCLGVALSGGSWLERLVWAALVVLLAWQAWRHWA